MRNHNWQEGPPGRRGRRGSRGGFDRRLRPQTSPEDRAEIGAWFKGSLVDGWYVGEPNIEIDDYEILVVGTLEAGDLAAASDQKAVAESARIDTFRRDTRERRIEIAERAEERFGRAVSWGAKVGDTTELFTTASVPFMSRLGMQHRRILDTLVEAGVARSRSEALAWCVELVGRNEGEWLAKLRDALDAVGRAREQGPATF
ncbi:MAG: hypothetical protein WCF24_03970 [Acidimicrobiales bacterium]